MSESTELENSFLEKSNPFALVFLKPGYSRPEIIQDVEKEFDELGAFIVSKGEFQFTPEKANEFYSHHKDMPWFNTLTRYISSAPVTYFVVSSSTQESQDTFYSNIRELVGKMRDKFGMKKEGATQRRGANPIHASTSLEEAKKELAILE